MLVILIIVILCCLKHIQSTKVWEFFLGYLRILSPKVYEFYHISFREKFHNFRSLSFRSLYFQEFVFPEFVFPDFVMAPRKGQICFKLLTRHGDLVASLLLILRTSTLRTSMIKHLLHLRYKNFLVLLFKKDNLGLKSCKNSMTSKKFNKWQNKKKYLNKKCWKSVNTIGKIYKNIHNF